MPDIKYQRPEPNYITKTSTTHANRFQGEAQEQNPLKASDLDREFNALIDNDNDISERMAEIAAGVFPGSNALENRNKIVYSDGTEAKWKMLSAENISDNAITSEKISNNAVIRGKVAIGAIGTNNLIDRNVTNAKLGNTSVDTRVLADSSVTTQKIQDGSVTASKLSVNSVTTEKILDNSVTTSKFADGSFTTDKLADKSLTPRKTNNCFLLGELKYSTLGFVHNIYCLENGWIPITTSRASMIPVDCFPELRNALRLERVDNSRYIRMLKNSTYTAFDFRPLLSAYPTLIGQTIIIKSEKHLKQHQSMDLINPNAMRRYLSENPEQTWVKELLDTLGDKFTDLQIYLEKYLEYYNSTLEDANTDYGTGGTQYQWHKKTRRFGEETIAMKLENMPKHTHGYTKTSKARSYVAIGNNPQYYDFNVTEAALQTTPAGDGKSLPHLPPSIALYGYIYGGDYDPNGWPLELRA